MTEQNLKPAQGQKNRHVPTLIVGIPVLVILLSTALYFLVDKRVVALDTVNKGTLIVPPLQLDEAPMNSSDGSAFKWAALEPKWAFVIIGDRYCSGSCERMLYIARQSIIALGKKMNQVRIIYLNTDSEISPELQTLFANEYKDISIAIIDRNALAQLFTGAAVEPLQSNTFFVADPKGWLMMYYRVDSTEQESLNVLGKDVLRDMNRLIK